MLVAVCGGNGIPPRDPPHGPDRGVVPEKMRTVIRQPVRVTAD